MGNIVNNTGSPIPIWDVCEGLFRLSRLFEVERSTLNMGGTIARAESWTW